MNNFDEFGRAVRTLNDDSRARLAAGTTWRTSHPGVEYVPGTLSAPALAAEKKIISICQGLLDMSGNPYTETQLIEFCFAHRALGYPDDPILFVADFVAWQRRDQHPAAETAGAWSGGSNRSAPPVRT